jgi:hypothetical protein
MKNDRIRAILLFFWVALTILISILAEAIPLGGQTIGDVLERYPTLITPAGYASALGCLIYAGMIGLAVYQALPHQQRSTRLRAIRGPLLVTLAANVAWILAWHHDRIFLSFVAMVTMAGSLAAAYVRLDRFPVGSRAELWLVRTPLSLSLAGVILATLLNTAVWLLTLGIDGGNATPIRAVVTLIVAAALCGAITLRQQDWPFTLAVLWMLTAIAAGQSGTPPVAATALLAASFVALAKTIGGITGLPAARRLEPTPEQQPRSLPPGTVA